MTPAAVPGPAGPLALRVHRPRHARTPGAGPMYLHGGGFVVGGPDSRHGASCALAEDLLWPATALAPDAQAEVFSLVDERLAAAS
ncbi:hypothetical protein HTV80_22250 [Streptomyces sp. Vc74B-19]|uniref:alpha/beta hydrolase n=1 Tax=unclassified Streptomyces TaxID=2593676 RepID=UPI001BFCC958|nr:MULTISPECIES: alpha/beta hydrolase [unclassified Streptomyces]MBT3165807.1 hypothetical protein [Streptomyces sp. Vc74B-19]MCO4696415.1 alpha/beta hydrolase [Streptomyces sp. RO-S4]MDU0303030.1 alpha/beta hydrolase [Streptomyces sp. PAL114]